MSIQKVKDSIPSKYKYSSNIIWQPLRFLVPIIGIYHRTNKYYIVIRTQDLVINSLRG